MRCFFCPSVAHPATGSEYSPGVVACRECTVRFWAWLRARMHSRKGAPDFWAAAMRREPNGGGPS